MISGSMNSFYPPTLNKYFRNRISAESQNNFPKTITIINPLFSLRQGALSSYRESRIFLEDSPAALFYGVNRIFPICIEVHAGVT
jgi:hypothetical protein